MVSISKEIIDLMGYISKAISFSRGYYVEYFNKDCNMKTDKIEKKVSQ